MLNPKHILHLQQALRHILGPQQDTTPNSITMSINKGQQMLSQLRTLPSYQCLLSHYLSKITPTNNNSNINSSSSSRQIVINGAKLVLLQLSKQDINSDNIWWDLLSYYYNCSENMEPYITRIVCKHFKQGQHQQYCTAYRQFINIRYWYISDCVIISQTVKMISITYAILCQIDNIVNKGQNKDKQWVQQQIQYIIDKLTESLGVLCQQYVSLAQIVCIYITRLITIWHQCTLQRINQTSIDQFICKQVSHIENTIKQSAQSPTIKFLLVLCTNITQNRVQQQQKQQKQHINIVFTQHMCMVLQKLLRSAPTKNGYWVQAMKALVYLITHFQNNKMLVVAHSQQIVKVYQQYIDKVQTRRPVYELMLNQGKQPIHDQHQIEQCCTWPQLSQQCRYSLLKICLTYNQGQLLDNMVKKSPLLLIKLSAFIPNTIFYSNNNNNSIILLLLDVIKAHINSVIHHPSSYTSNNKSQLISCLIYIHRYVADNPNFDLIDICSIVLNLRTAHSYMHIYCDSILSKSVNMVVTCVQLCRIWDFMEVLACNLQHNYMDVTYVSYYPILLILDTAQQLHIKHSKIDILHLLHTILQLLIQSLRCNELSNTTPTLLQQNRKINVYHDDGCSSATQMFYKWAEIFNKYIMICTKMQTMNRRQPQIIFNNNININQLQITVQKAVKYIFKNELYSAATAYIYVFHQTHIKNTIKNQHTNNYQILQFVKNLRTHQFWKGFDRSQIMFYGCILIGIIQGFKQILNLNAEYNCFIDVLRYLICNGYLQSTDIAFLMNDFVQFSELYGIQFPSQHIMAQIAQKQNQICLNRSQQKDHLSVNALFQHCSI